MVWEILPSSQPEKGRGQPHPADPTHQEWIYASLLVAAIETTGKHESEGSKQNSLPTEVAQTTLGVGRALDLWIGFWEPPGTADRDIWQGRQTQINHGPFFWSSCSQPLTSTWPWAPHPEHISTPQTPHTGKSGRLTFQPEVLTPWNVLPSSFYPSFMGFLTGTEDTSRGQRRPHLLRGLRFKGRIGVFYF